MSIIVNLNQVNTGQKHCVKSVRIRSFSGPYFPRNRTEYEEITSISPYSVRIRENTDQKNSEYGQFLHSEDRNVQALYRVRGNC